MVRETAPDEQKPGDPPAGDPPADQTPPDAPEGDVEGVELIVTADIGGTIDGVNVPRPGGRITLPAHEAATWLRFGYGVPVED